MPSVLVTGANRGIGLEFARQYADDGWRVHATCRDPSRAGALAGRSGDITIHALDIGDFAAIDRLARELKDAAIDVLILNAAIYGAGPQTLESLDYEEWARTLRIDCMAQVRIAHAFLEQVARSGRKTIAAMTSKMGSIADNSSGGAYIYRTAKAALNMAVKSLAVDLAPRGIIAVVVHPGWVKTDMGGPGALIRAEESVAGMRRVIAGLTLRDTGKFLDYKGAEIPW